MDSEQQPPADESGSSSTVSHCLIDQIVVNFVPVVFGSAARSSRRDRSAIRSCLTHPSQIIRGDRVTHLVYDVAKG
jgi:hypothetical protein